MNNNKKFSIGFINTDELGLWTGEVSVYTANMAKLYRNNGHKVHLFVRNNLPIPNNLKNVYIHFIKSPKRIGLFTLLKYRFNKKLALRELYKKALFEEVQAVFNKGFIDVIDVPEKTGIAEKLFELNIPTTVSFHYADHLEKSFDEKFKETKISSLIELDEKMILSKAHSYISPSKHISNFYRKNNSISTLDSIFYVNYPFETKFFTEIEPKLSDDTINILISTRYQKRKRIDEFLEEITKTILKKSYDKKIEFTFIGLEDKKIINKIRSNPYYNKNVFYQKYVVRPKFRDQYAMANIVVFPTTSESFSYTLAESLFSKKIVIVASNSGNDELIEDGVDGFVFENDNFEHLVRILDSIISKDKLRNFISSNLSEQTQNYFNYTRVYQRSKSAYMRAMIDYNKVEEEIDEE